MGEEMGKFLSASRDRREDVPLLVSYFVQKFSKQMQKNVEAVPAAVMKGPTLRDALQQNSLVMLGEHVVRN